MRKRYNWPAFRTVPKKRAYLISAGKRRRGGRREARTERVFMRVFSVKRWGAVYKCCGLLLTNHDMLGWWFVWQGARGCSGTEVHTVALAPPPGLVGS